MAELLEASFHLGDSLRSLRASHQLTSAVPDSSEKLQSQIPQLGLQRERPSPSSEVWLFYFYSFPGNADQLMVVPACENTDSNSKPHGCHVVFHSLSFASLHTALQMNNVDSFLLGLLGATSLQGLYFDKRQIMIP